MLAARSLLRLPPTVRLSLFQQSLASRYNYVPPLSSPPLSSTRYRLFSASRPRQSLETVLVAAPCTLMSTLHLALPWYAVLPLTALVVRTFIILPFITLPVRAATQRKIYLQPLSRAAVQTDMRRRVSEWEDNAMKLGLMRKRMPPAQLMLNRLSGRRYINAQLGKEFKTRTFWKRVRGLGVVLVMSDAIRHLSGARQGLLATLLNAYDSITTRITNLLGLDFPSWDVGRLNSVVGQVSASLERLNSVVGRVSASLEKLTTSLSGARGDGEVAPTLDNTLSTNGTATGAGHAKVNDFGSVEASGSAGHLPDTSFAEAGTGIANPAFTPETAPGTSGTATDLSPFYDPTLTTGGLPFCPDLTLPDPTLVLPILLSATFAASIVLAPRVIQPTSPAEATPARGTVTATSATALASTSKPYMTRRFTLLQRLGLSFSLVMLLPALQLPAGLLLYFVSSIAIGIVQTRWLNRLAPMRPAPTQCKGSLKAG
ncbi:hypothetical protein LTR66_005398 [Elasticomyces elasticus]|nr:hypothetical protein LTR66_005398 [Elasticomyces elasticus]